ncbi:hypothetical protein OG203_16270 [Nocardia sp. NBC_01499]|uniref:hypothetical protein n=1 Tax=Nocardia sp. NBC_01499 TaxID=2903597 RepID=UPI00386ABB1B
MTRALELATLTSSEVVEKVLGVAAVAGRFDDGDLTAILDHLPKFSRVGEVVRVDETHSAQPGTAKASNIVVSLKLWCAATGRRNIGVRRRSVAW